MRIKIPKIDLERMYIKDQLTLVEISKQTGVPRTTLSRWFCEYGIPILDQRIGSVMGQRFGRLAVLQVLHEGHRGAITKCICRCDCGAEVSVRRTNLTRTQSCGCFDLEMHRRADGMGARQSLLRDYKDSARKKGVSWGLADTQVFDLFQLNCHYCGRPPLTYRGRKGMFGSYLFNGIDRVDPSKGYIDGNVVSCCPECNYAKRRLSVNEFLNHVQKIHEPQVQLISSEGITDKMTGWAYAHTKANARQFKRVFSMTRDQVRQIVSSPCAYCGSTGRVCYGSPIPRNGIDRVDSSQGYLPGNCVPCCWMCNWMKRDHAVSDFLTWVGRVKDFQRGQSIYLSQSNSTR